MKKVLWLAALLVAGLPASAQTTDNAKKAVPMQKVKVVKAPKTEAQVKAEKDAKTAFVGQQFTDFEMADTAVHGLRDGRHGRQDAQVERIRR